MIEEEDFFARVREFMSSRIGDRAAPLTEDTELVESGILDSLLVLEFFFFLEELRGSAIDPDNFSVRSISTMRRAYQLVIPSE